MVADSMDLRQKVLFFCEMIEVLNLVNGSVSGHCQVTCTVFYNDTPTLSDKKKTYLSSPLCRRTVCSQIPLQVLNNFALLSRILSCG